LLLPTRIGYENFRFHVKHLQLTFPEIPSLNRPPRRPAFSHVNMNPSRTITTTVINTDTDEGKLTYIPKEFSRRKMVGANHVSRGSVTVLRTASTTYSFIVNAATIATANLKRAANVATELLQQVNQSLVHV
jgi:hypothetical protein